MRRALLLLLLAAPLAARAAPPGPDFALSANDNHTTVIEGKTVGLKNASPDTLSYIDLSHDVPRVTWSIDVPFSDIGPPMAIAISHDARFALVTSSTRADPNAPDNTAPDDRLSVVDLTTSPGRVVQTLHAGAGASAVRLSPDGELAIVANRFEGTLSLFRVKGMALEPAGKITLDNPKAQPVGVVFSHDGALVLVSRLADHMVSVFHRAGERLTPDPRPITTGVAPDTMDINPAGTLVAVSNVGRGDGDVDTVSLIDLTASPPRTIDTIAVPSAPEMVKFSPDGRYLAVNCINGSVKAQSSPFYHAQGVLTLYAVGSPAHGEARPGAMLRKVAEARDGGWTQGVAFSRDGRLLLVQNMREHEVVAYRFQGNRLIPGVHLAVPGGPAAIATPWP